MKLVIRRKWLDDISTIGELFIDGVFFCYTLEDRVREKKIAGITAIPSGIYNLTLTYSDKFKQRMPLIHNVLEFDGVRIHYGNEAADTEGCVLVGDQKEDDFIGQSRAAFSRLMQLLLADDGPSTIEVCLADDCVDKRTSGG